MGLYRKSILVDMPVLEKQENGMIVHNRKNIGKIFVAGIVLLGLFVPSLSLAGSNPVVTVGDSSSGGVINFDPSFFSTGSDAGGSSSYSISSGVAVTVTSIATAISTGSLGQDQVTNGFGAGGAAVTLTEQSLENVKNAASTPSVIVDGETMTPLAALLAVSTSTELGGIRVIMPNGVETDLPSVVSNMTLALTSGDATLIGTALNDAAIALSQALRDGEDSSDLKSAGDAIADLLEAARNS